MLEKTKAHVDERVGNVKADFGDIKSSLSGAYRTAVTDNVPDAAIDLAKDSFNSVMNMWRRFASSNRGIIGK